MKKATLSTSILVLVLSVLWIYFNRGYHDLLFYLVDLPVFVFLYGLLFFIGIPSISQGIRFGNKLSLYSTVGFPLILLGLYYLYLLVYDQPIIEGGSLLLPYLIIFPVLAFYHRTLDYKIISWFDILVVVLFLWPITILDLAGESDLPLDGVHFDSVYRMVLLLVGVYSFVVIRRLRNVGFYVDISGRKLWTAVWVWGVYIGVVWIIGSSISMVEFHGWNGTEGMNIEEITISFLTIYLHTALFEELFFRGFLQNMLAQKIRQTSYPLTFWIISFLATVILSLIIGLTMRVELFWLPSVIALLVFLGAYLLSNLFVGYKHHYLALAIISILFGLVHFHVGSVVYVGFAILAGWAYGYVYWKTRSVLYAALTHTLVNISPLILGIEIMH